MFVRIFLCLAMAVSLYAGEQTSYNVSYAGGSLQGVATGDDFKLVLEKETISLLRKGGPTVTIPVAKISEVSYGLEARRRVGSAMALSIPTLGLGGLLALSHSKKHFVGISWDGGGLVVQAGKNEFRGIIAALVGLTGKKAVNSDSTVLTVQ